MKAQGMELTDLGLLVATGTLHLVFENVFGAKGPFLVVAGALWLLWIVRRRRQDPMLLTSWGMSRRKLGSGCLAACALTLPAAGLLLLLGRLSGHPVPVHAAAVVILYLPWALVQQVALQGILLRGLERLLPPAAAVVGAALLFSGAHLPDLKLCALTFAGAVGWTVLFRLRRTVWPLVLSHAVLGTLTYIAVLGRDPWPDVLRAVSAISAFVGLSPPPGAP
jgi:membrane protease YdiL (CAAX protease family)